MDSKPAIQKPKLDKSILRSIIKVYWTHLRRYPKSAAAIVLSAVVINIIHILIPWFFKSFFDILGSASAPSQELATKLINVLLLIAGLTVIRWIFHRTFGFTTVYMQANIMNDLLATSFDNLLKHSYKFFTENFTGSLVRKVNRLSRAFEDITDEINGKLIPLIVLISGILIILFNRHVILGAILSLWLVIFLAIYYFIAIWKMPYDRAKAEKDSETTGVLADALTNATTIKLFSAAEREKGRYRNVTSELLKLRLFTWRVNEWTDAIQGILTMAIELALFFASVRLWQKGLLTIGDFALIQGFLVVLFTRIWDLGRVVRRIYESLADAWEMVEILETPLGIVDSKTALPLVIKNGSIEFKNVEFRFHQTRKTLNDFNFSIKPGEKVALVGPSGAGKTTVVTLLLRFHDLHAGQIIIDGQDIVHVTQDSLRRNIALVPQESILFHRTLKENIRYGRPEANDEEVVEAAKKANCHDFISELPYGYETYVGERGIKLSGGERQRVAIARAVLKNAPILILDEATSSLDSESEKLIQEALRTLMRGRTTIVIAHRLSTIKQMDRIVIIDEGKIIAEGTHDELLEREGMYKTLWEIQAGGFIPLETDRDQ